MNQEEILISNATQRNWDKLNTHSSDRLVARANKTRSKKTIIPKNYIHSHCLSDLMEDVSNLPESRQTIIFSLCLEMLEALCPDSKNLESFVSEYKSCKHIPLTIPSELLKPDHTDWIGYIYQALIPEGERNLSGQYYTNFGIVSKMVESVSVSDNELFLDPCCGSGAFLLNVKAESLDRLYGIDNDEIAVMIAKANLIANYPQAKSYPHIFLYDFLEEDTGYPDNPIDGLYFDYIYTNPPWGISKTHRYKSSEIHSGERASLFLEKATRFLKQGGKMNFLLPSSLLNIKVHRDIRSFILHNTAIESIELFNEKINGVYSGFFSILLSNTAPGERQNYALLKNGKTVEISYDISPSSSTISLNGYEDESVLGLIESRRNDTLAHSIWALGIVTGDNKGKLKEAPFLHSEPIYTGKDICRYTLKNPSKHILYDRSLLQQCARDEIYRAPEKLVYKFVSGKLCFAYDTGGSLFLNSANILIPSIEGMSTKTVLAFLNSELFSFYYRKRFADIKILKGNLSNLPFPKITAEQDAHLSQYVDSILSGDESKAHDIDECIFEMYGIEPDLARYILSVTAEK